MRTKWYSGPLLALLAATSPALGGEIYRWVDEQGVTNFSQEPPDDPVQDARVLHLESLSTIPSVDVTALLEVAERLEASRLAREQARAAQQQASREARLQEQETQPAITTYQPPILLHTGFRTPPHLYPHFRPIEKPPPRRPHRNESGHDQGTAVASGPPAHPSR
ncbi:MAG TPA: DUF4124 domain-containing protein [Gammaproteobacteria bacterium]|nr:DUF4124 domain-containing protein [Gammaproteobacteria bacterium]